MSRDFPQSDAIFGADNLSEHRRQVAAGNDEVAAKNATDEELCRRDFMERRVAAGKPKFNADDIIGSGHGAFGFRGASVRRPSGRAGQIGTDLVESA